MRLIIRLLFVTTLSCLAAPSFVAAADSDYHHVHLMAPDGQAAAAWYIEHMGCEVYEREGACRYGHVQVLFIEREPQGGSVGTAVDHIGFSFHDLDTKMVAWKAAGLTILEDVRELDGLFKQAFIEDPWGTKIEVVEDREDLGFHHLHLRSPNPTATLAWYEDIFGGERDRMKGRLQGLRWGRIWLLISEHTGAPLVRMQNGPFLTSGRSIHHLGWIVTDLSAFGTKIEAKGIPFADGPRPYTNAADQKLIISFVTGPENAFIEVVEFVE